MDVKIILDGWPFDDAHEANNVRKIVGLDRRMKLQIRLRNGLIQWEVEGPPSGERPYGFDSALHYCRRLVENLGGLDPEPGEESCLDESMVEDLEAELRDYNKRRHAFLLIGDYVHAVSDAQHALDILAFVREASSDLTVVYRFDRFRPQIIADRARAEALLELRREQHQRAVKALNGGIEEVEAFFLSHGMEAGMARSRERQGLVDFRRSLRERYNIPLTDVELLSALKAEQRVAVEQEDYEMAARLRDKISLIEERLSGAV